MIHYGEILKEQVNRGLSYKADVVIMIYWMKTTMFKATMKIFWFWFIYFFFYFKEKHQVNSYKMAKQQNHLNSL